MSARTFLFLKLLAMRKITFFIVSILCITACNNEILDREKESAESQSIELSMPEATEVSVYSEATVSECTIDSIWVLEFNNSGTTLLHHELIKGSRIINRGYATQLLPQLSFTPTNGSLIICIANCDSTASFSGLTKSTINNCFSSRREYHSDGESLPMYGELGWSTSSYTCRMTRAVAKIRVQMGSEVSDVTGNFTAENVSYKIYNHSKGGNIQPSTPVVGKPQTLPGTGTGTLFYLLQKNGTGAKNAYLYEYPTSTKDATGSSTLDKTKFDAGRQYIILEKDNSGTKTYYRLDFYNADTFININRNHHYIFTIQKVRSEGYTALAQAQNNPGSNIEYTIKIDDDSEFVKSNGQYAIVTSVDTAYVVPKGTAVNNYTIATAKYVLPAGISLGASTTNTITVKSVVSPGTMALSGITTLSASNGDIKVNTNASFTEGVITIKLGNITHDLHVKAKP